MLAYHSDEVASRKRRSSASHTQTPSPRSISSCSRETAPMSANGCQKGFVVVTAMAWTVTAGGALRCPTRPGSGVQRGPQRGGGVLDGRAGVLRGLPAPEAVQAARTAVERHRDARLA